MCLLPYIYDICASTSIIKYPRNIEPCNRRRNRKDHQCIKINILLIRCTPNNSPQKMLVGASPGNYSMINVSLSSRQFPRSFSHALVKPLLKKPNADCEILKNYRPASNLTFLSKILEKVVAHRLLNCSRTCPRMAYMRRCSQHMELPTAQNPP